MPTGRLCQCGRCSPIYQKGDCRLCYLYNFDPAYHVKWTGQRLEHIKPVSDVKINNLPDRNFNGSICSWRDKTYFAFRRSWDRARTNLVELGSDWQPVSPPIQLNLTCPQAKAGQEDARLFIHNDQLHLSYTGTSWKEDGNLEVSICFARLDQNLRVEDVWYPHFILRQHAEKNWMPFSHEGDLYVVYTISPHRVCLHSQKQIWEFPVEEVATLPSASYGLLRGGCPPILHNGEYYSFFHGVTKPSWGTYSIGLYTFQNKYPFKPLRFCPYPLLWPNPKEKPSPMVADVVFPGGAIYRDGCWNVSYGEFDSCNRVISWKEEDIERLLVKV